MSDRLDFDTVLERLAELNCAPRHGRGDEWSARCPAHDDAVASLSLRIGEDRQLLLRCFAGCEFGDVLAALVTGERMYREPVARPQRRAVPGDSPDPLRVLAWYSYTNRDRSLLHWVLRLPPKRFRPLLPDGATWAFPPRQDLVLYNYPDVWAGIRAGKPIFVCEGEKDSIAVVRYSNSTAIGTTSAMGAASPWLPQYTDMLAGGLITVVADRDEPGYERAFRVAHEVVSVASALRVVEPATGKDAADHFAAGCGLDEFTVLEVLA